MTLKMMGRKRGMTQIFDKDGNIVVCTVIEAEKNVITQVKTKEKEGYQAVQTGFETLSAGDERTISRRAGKPRAGHFKKAGVSPKRFLTESRVHSLEGYEVGGELGVSQFEEIKYVDVTADSKGKGYQGLMKLKNFSGMKASHGTGPVHRHAGSTGQRSTPGRCYKGSPRASRMGGRRTTVQNLEIIEVVDTADKQLIVVKGAVPGPKNGLVCVQEAIKHQLNQKK